MAQPLLYTGGIHMDFSGPFLADDWGMAQSINDAILRMAEHGLVCGVSIMPNTEHASYRLEELRKIAARKKLRINAHLNLTYGRPLSAGSQLADKKNFFLPIAHQWINLFRRGARKDLKEEISTQLNFFKEVGLPLEGIDGHHHIHLHPVVFSTIREFASVDNLQFRIPADIRHPGSFLAARALLLKNPILKKRGLRVGYLKKGDWQSPARLKKILESPRKYICHPATSVEDLSLSSPRDSLREPRVAQFKAILETFTSPGGVGYWNKKIVAWEFSRYSLFSSAHPLAWPIRARMNQTIKLLKHLAAPGAKIVDLGCGTGTLARQIRGLGLNYTGIDFSSVAINEAQKQASPGEVFVCGPASNDIPDADITVMLGLLDWLNDSELTALAKNLTSPVIIFSFTDGKRRGSVPLYRLYRKIIDLRVYKGQTCARTFNFEAIQSLFAQTGYTLEVLRTPFMGYGRLVIGKKNAP